MKTFYRGLISCGTLACVLSAAISSHAAVNNGDFETGDLTSWPKIGKALAEDDFGVTPPQGTYQAYIDNTGNFAVHYSLVFTFLGVSGPTFGALGKGAPTWGSAMSQDIIVSAGDVLTFDWNFLTDEHNESATFNDFAFYTVGSSAYFLASRNSTYATLNLVSPPVGFDGQTNYATHSHTFTSSGTFKLGFGVFNVGDTGHNSVLLVDSVVIAGVPEPGAMALAGIAAGIVVGARRRRRG